MLEELKARFYCFHLISYCAISGFVCTYAYYTRYTPRVEAMTVEKPSLIQPHPSLQKYYTAIESRLGYKLFLGGTRHFGYYTPGTKWPFPINAALRRMEDHLYDVLKLQPGSLVLDAGCGVCHVAMHLARKGLRVHGIDIIDNHVNWAEREIRTNHLEQVVSVELMDYQNMSPLSSSSFDGVYTMETFVHATDPEKALVEFRRVLKPGGSLALYEYDHSEYDRNTIEEDRRELMEAMEEVNRNAAMPANASFTQGTMERMLEEQGFVDIKSEDISENVKPMMRLFFLVAYIPYLIICFLGLKHWFVNTVAGVQGYRVLKRKLWRYVVVTAKKPSHAPVDARELRQRRVA